MGITMIPARREMLEAQKIPEIWEFPGNSRRGNSWEGKVYSRMGGRVQEFSIQYPWSLVPCLRPLMYLARASAANTYVHLRSIERKAAV